LSEKISVREFEELLRQALHDNSAQYLDHLYDNTCWKKDMEREQIRSLMINITRFYKRVDWKDYEGSISLEPPGREARRLAERARRKGQVEKSRAKQREYMRRHRAKNGT
jgi:hypothetical protein